MAYLSKLNCFKILFPSSRASFLLTFAMIKGKEVVVEEEQAVADQDKRSHKGMTRGEIMEYEMTRVSEEMNALQEEVKQSQEKKTQLKSYQEKLENLKRLNEAGIR